MLRLEAPTNDISIKFRETEMMTGVQYYVHVVKEMCRSKTVIYRIRFVAEHLPYFVSPFGIRHDEILVSTSVVLNRGSLSQSRRFAGGQDTHPNHTTEVTLICSKNLINHFLFIRKSCFVLLAMLLMHS